MLLRCHSISTIIFIIMLLFVFSNHLPINHSWVITAFMFEEIPEAMLGRIIGLETEEQHIKNKDNRDLITSEFRSWNIFSSKSFNLVKNGVK